MFASLVDHQIPSANMGLFRVVHALPVRNVGMHSRPRRDTAPKPKLRLALSNFENLHDF